jgi:hypothetical protein
MVQWWGGEVRGGPRAGRDEAGPASTARSADRTARPETGAWEQQRAAWQRAAAAAASLEAASAKLAQLTD